MRNLCAHDESNYQDVDAVFPACDVVLERTYHTKANAQAMMETMRSYAYIDAYGRLNCVSSTQVPFHIRRILSNALEIPKSKIRVVKPRIGGGFGSQANRLYRDLQRFCHMEAKKAKQDRLYPGRNAHCQQF